MNFKVIYKNKTHDNVVADEMKAIDSEKLTTAFMVVATEHIDEMDKPYIAIKTKEHQVIVGTKSGTNKVVADTILEALGVDSPVMTMSMNIEPKTNTVNVFNGTTKLGTKSFDVTDGDVSIDSYLTSLESEVVAPEGKEFAGWAFSNNATKPANKPIKALSTKTTTSVYAIFTDKVTD